MFLPTYDSTDTSRSYGAFEISLVISSINIGSLRDFKWEPYGCYWNSEPALGDLRS
jgi:hypothetical protein